jgi:uncharacterized protein (DUF885 family)
MPNVTQPDRSPSPVDQLADQLWDDILELNPTTATVYGDERFNDRLEDPSPAGRAKARNLMVRTKAAADAISPDGLSVEDRITRDMLIVIADQAIEQHDQGVHRLAVVDQIGGPQSPGSSRTATSWPPTPTSFARASKRVSSRRGSWPSGRSPSSIG